MSKINNFIFLKCAELLQKSACLHRFREEAESGVWHANNIETKGNKYQGMGESEHAEECDQWAKCLLGAASCIEKEEAEIMKCLNNISDVLKIK